MITVECCGQCNCECGCSENCRSNDHGIVVVELDGGCDLRVRRFGSEELLGVWQKGDGEVYKHIVIRGENLSTEDKT